MQFSRHQNNVFLNSEYFNDVANKESRLFITRNVKQIRENWMRQIWQISVVSCNLM